MTGLSEKLMEIGFFGRMAEIVGRTVDHVPAPGSTTIADLRASLAAAYPAAAEDLMSPSLKACIGDVVVGDDASIAGVARVEFFPPLSGG